MEKVSFKMDGEESVDFYVLEQTMVSGIQYFLVTDTCEGDGDAWIMKDLSGTEDTEGIYEFVDDDEELKAVAGIFASLLEDTELEL